MTFGALLYLSRRLARWLYPRASSLLPRWKATSHEKTDTDASKMRPRRIYRRKPERLFKLFLVAFIAAFYYVWATYVDPPTPFVRTSPRTVQHGVWKATPPDDESAKAAPIRKALRHAFAGYREYAFGYDDIDPVTATGKGEKDAKASYLVEVAPALALMGLWDEFDVALRHIVDAVDFDKATGLMNPADATSRYLGALVSLIEMADAGIITDNAMPSAFRAKLVEKTVQLAEKLKTAFASSSGLPYPRIDVKTGEGVGRPQTQMGENPHEKEYAINPDHAALMLLENVALSRLLSINSYRQAAEKAWAHLVSAKSLSVTYSLQNGPIDIFTGNAEGTERHWDAGHEAYYATLIDSVMLGVSTSLSSAQEARFNNSANALRWNVTSKSVPSDTYLMQHLYIGRFEDGYYYNEQSQHACSAAGTLILGGAYLKVYSFTLFGQALLEGCRHLQISSPRNLGAQKWSWLGMPLSPNGTYTPTTKRAKAEVEAHGYWTVDARFVWNPNYFQSLFYAWRVTGDARYKDWAWEAFRSAQQNCKTQYGYAGVKDVMDASTKGSDSKRWTSDVRGGDVVQSLRWLWLIFSDPEIGSLDKWVFTSSGNMLKRG